MHSVSVLACVRQKLHGALAEFGPYCLTAVCTCCANTCLRWHRMKAFSSLVIVAGHCLILVDFRGCQSPIIGVNLIVLEHRLVALLLGSVYIYLSCISRFYVWQEAITIAVMIV